MSYNLNFERIEVYSEDGLVRVDLDWEGEGLDGDYDGTDPADVPLLRYGISRKFTKECRNDKFYYLTNEHFEGRKIGEWVCVDDGSYCTQLPINAPREQLIDAAQFILGYVKDGVRDLNRQKRVYELLSWICLQDGKPHCEQKIVA